MIIFVKLTKKPIIMHLIGLVLFAMALGLGALFLLAKAQKENLGKLFSVSAYVVLTVSVLIILFSITAGIMHCCHGKGGGCGKGKMEHGCSMMKGGCETDGHCGATQSCSKGGESCSMMKGSCSKGGSSCSMGGMSGGDCMMMNPHGGKKFNKKIVKMMHGDSIDVDVKVITE